MDPQGFNENSRLRASDADRDRAAAVINNALAEGRLTAEEHSDRLDAIYAAKTHAELVPLLDDLPASTRRAHGPRRPQVRRAGRAGRPHRRDLRRGEPQGRLASRAGDAVLTVFGGAELDFREAVLPGPEVSCTRPLCSAAWRSLVPPEMRVVDNGIAILGGREIAGNPAEAAGQTHRCCGSRAPASWAASRSSARPASGEGSAAPQAA